LADQALNLAVNQLLKNNSVTATVG
jgi:hypothetical protein